MRTYLATLHKRSPKHKKRFALLASGGVTLLIFAVWVSVNFGSSALPASANKSINEVSPVEFLSESISDFKDGLNIYGR